MLLDVFLIDPPGLVMPLKHKKSKKVIVRFVLIVKPPIGTQFIRTDLLTTKKAITQKYGKNGTRGSIFGFRSKRKKKA